MLLAKAREGALSSTWTSVHCSFFLNLSTGLLPLDSETEGGAACAPACSLQGGDKGLAQRDLQREMPLSLSVTRGPLQGRVGAEGTAQVEHLAVLQDIRMSALVVIQSNIRGLGDACLSSGMLLHLKCPQNTLRQQVNCYLCGAQESREDTEWCLRSMTGFPTLP